MTCPRPSPWSPTPIRSARGPWSSCCPWAGTPCTPPPSGARAAAGCCRLAGPPTETGGAVPAGSDPGTAPPSRWGENCHEPVPDEDSRATAPCLRRRAKSRLVRHQDRQRAPEMDAARRQAGDHRRNPERRLARDAERLARTEKSRTEVLELTALVDCDGCGTTYEGRWQDESMSVQDMAEPPEAEQTCPACG